MPKYQVWWLTPESIDSNGVKRRGRWEPEEEPRAPKTSRRKMMKALHAEKHPLAFKVRKVS